MDVNFTTFTIREVSNILKVSELTVRRCVKEKTLKASRIIGQWRVTALDLDRFMRNSGGSGFLGLDEIPTGATNTNDKVKIKKPKKKEPSKKDEVEEVDEEDEEEWTDVLDEE